ncbi:MAG: RdgB/HAM1 family non-canonical purine NTP pyrophosphatase [Pseudomonadota bacterium]
MELIVATGNPGKQREIGQTLRSPGIVLTTHPDLNMASVEETGATFVENALLKARYASQIAKRPALADDSGLEVDALGGAPGIYSARYAGTSASDEANVDKLLSALANVADERRTARFRCVIVVLRHALDPAPMICEGCWEGRIAFERRGTGGFGYDPVFIPDGMARHASELSPDEKNAVSHRGQALATLANGIGPFLARHR